jgi:integrase
VESGKRRKIWRGHFYVYVPTPDGKEIRQHRNVTLGAKSELKKWQAAKKLQEIIDRESAGTAFRPEPNATLSWFWESRFLPLQLQWRDSTRVVLVAIFNKHVLSKFGESRLDSLKRFDLQTHLNTLANEYSKSLVKKVRTWIKAVLDEAVEQEFIGKNPARKLALPPTRGTCKRFLTIAEYRRMLDELEGRDRLIFRLFVMCAFRPGELFALRWRCRNGNTLRIEESVSRGKIGLPKTKSSAAVVALPNSLAHELDEWYEFSGRPKPDDFIFPSRAKTPLHAGNYLKRDVLRPAADRAGIADLTFQALRRTFATHFHGIGTVKDQQSQMRHATAQITLDVYTQSVAESLISAVEAFDAKLNNKPAGKQGIRDAGIKPRRKSTANKPRNVLNPTEPKSRFGESASD